MSTARLPIEDVTDALLHSIKQAIDAANSTKLYAKALYEWSLELDDCEDDIRDVVDRFCYAIFAVGDLQSRFATILEESRQLFNGVKSVEEGHKLHRLKSRRISKQLSVLRPTDAAEERLMNELDLEFHRVLDERRILRESWAGAKRRQLRHIFDAQFRGLREFGEKVAVLSSCSGPLLDQLREDGLGDGYHGRYATLAIRRNLEIYLNNWTGPAFDASCALPSNSGVSDIEDIRCTTFGETHANELADLSITPDSDSGTAVDTVSSDDHCQSKYGLLFIPGREKCESLPPSLNPDVDVVYEQNPALLDAHIHFGHKLHEANRMSVVRLTPTKVVKFGEIVTLSEAWAMRLVSERTSVPVPRVFEAFSRKAEHSERFVQYIIMEYIDGVSLDNLWDEMSLEGKEAVMLQLRESVVQLHSLTGTSVQGADGGQILHYYRQAEWGGPFPTEAEFHAWLLSRLDQTPQPYQTLMRRLLPQGHAIVFSHGDIAPRNLIVKDGRIAAIVDWETAGWFPEYWDFTKSALAAQFWKGSDWSDFVSQAMRPYYAELAAYLWLMSCA